MVGVEIDVKIPRTDCAVAASRIAVSKDKRPLATRTGSDGECEVEEMEVSRMWGVMVRTRGMSTVAHEVTNVHVQDAIIAIDG